MHARSRRFLSAFSLSLVASAVLLAGCDSDNPSSPLEELEGFYDITELRFDPSAQAVLDADVEERLIASSSSVEILGSGRAFIRFKFEGEPSDLAEGTVSATSSTVRFTAEDEDEARRLSELLLPSSFTLSRSDDNQRLSGQISTTANLQAFDSDLYGGLMAQPGTLYIILDRRTDG